MGIMTIDGQSIEFTDEPNVLSVIRKAGIDIPTLCYHSELSIYGACRLCTVENDRGKTFASCSENQRRNGHLYEYTKADALPQTDPGTAFSGPLQRLYYLYQEWRMSSAGTGSSHGCS